MQGEQHDVSAIQTTSQYEIIGVDDTDIADDAVESQLRLIQTQNEQNRLMVRNQLEKMQ